MSNDPAKHLLEKKDDHVPNNEGNQTTPGAPPRSIQPTAPGNSDNLNGPNQQDDNHFDWEACLGDSSALNMSVNASLEEEQLFGLPIDDDDQRSPR